jgi:hypothetical protein
MNAESAGLVTITSKVIDNDSIRDEQEGFERKTFKIETQISSMK